MLRTALCAALLLLIGGTTAQAARICDLGEKPPDDGTVVTISGRIVESYDRDDNGDYGHDVRDSCALAYVYRSRPIQCSGTVTITGTYDDDATFELDMMGDEAVVAIRVTKATCK